MPVVGSRDSRQEYSTEILCFGEPLVGFFRKDMTGPFSPYLPAIGGDSSNVALGVSKLGHYSGYVTRLGKDLFGRMIMKAWKEAGIDVSRVIPDEERDTGIYFASYDEGGSHQFFYRRRFSAASAYSVKDAENASLEGIRVFHLSGISQAISRGCLESSYYFMKKCIDRGITLSYDLNYRGALWSRDFFSGTAWQTIKEYAHILSLTIEEAHLLGLTGDPEKIVLELLSHGPEMVALKLGSHGSVVGRDGEVVRSGAFEVDVVDTTGAGDVFTSAVIVAYMEGMDLPEAALFANGAASFVCGKVGSTSGQPSREEISKMIKERKKS